MPFRVSVFRKDRLMSVHTALRTSLPILFMGVAAVLVPALAPLAQQNGV